MARQTKESYCQAVRKKSSDEGFKEQKKLYIYLNTHPRLSAEHGKDDDVKNLSYVIKVGPYSVAYVQDDGLVQIYFLRLNHINTPLPDYLRETYRSKTYEVLDVKSKSEAWKEVGRLGANLSLDKLKELLDWIAGEVGKIKGL